jgi:uncharacterized glyoxalase superfamily metalloenzyme YdcJ
MTEPAKKKPRSESQIAAFEKARKAREDNLRRKFEAEKKPEPVIETVTEEEEEKEDEPMPQAAAAVTVQQQQPKQEDQHEYIDFDPESFRNELYDKLHAANEEIKALKEHVHGVSSKQEELQSSWQRHGVRSNNLLNFV